MAVRIAGSARKDGITYYGEHYIASVTVRDGKEPVVELRERKLRPKSSKEKTPGNLPGVRGLVSLFMNNPEMTAMTGIQLALELTDEDSAVHVLLNLADLGLGGYIVYRHYGDVSRVRRFHGAEHKTVAAVDRDLPVDREHVRRMPRIHPRCGTNFAGFYLCSLLAVSALPIRSDTAKTLLAMGIAYEGFTLDRGKYGRYLKPFDKLGSWLQAHVTTAEPGEIELEAGILAVQTLLEAEEAYEEEGTRNTHAHPSACTSSGSL